MAKQAATTRINLGLSEGTMGRLGEASKAQAGVGEYASKGFDEFLDTASEYAQGKLDDKLAEQDKAEADAEAKSEEGRNKMNKAAEEALALGGSLGDNYFDSVHDDIEGLKEEYIGATTEKEKARVMQKFNQYSAEAKTVKEGRNSMADSWEKGLMSDAMNDDQRHVMEQFLSNKTKITKDADGNRVHEITFEDGRTEQFTSDQINDMQILKAPAHNDLAKLATAAETSGGEGAFFNEAKTRINVKNSLKVEDLPSLINDISEATGTSFKKAMKAGVSNATYMDLGKMVPSVNGKEIAEIEPPEEFWYSNISPADEKALTAALTDPDNDFYNADVTMKALENYHTTFIGQQYKTTLEGTDESQVVASREKGISQAQQLDAKQKEWEKLNPGKTWTESGANPR